MMRRVVFGIALFACCVNCGAGEGDPVAIGLWAGGRVSVETFHGFRVDLCESGERRDGSDGEIDKTVRLGEAVNHVLSRPANHDEATWKPLSESSERLDDDLLVQSRTGPGQNTVTVKVDGIRIVVTSLNDPLEPSAVIRNEGSADAIVFLGGTNNERSISQFATLVRSMDPRVIIFEQSNVRFANDLRQTLDIENPIVIEGHNAYAVSAGGEPELKMKIIVLADSPWSMPDEMESLFSKMEASCAASQKVLAKLTVDQMNFKPANGTHTPRWNAEHMAGRQLQFFSQIYHAIDPAIPVIDLNPKQMPGDYVAAHPNWSGAEEARQMHRVSNFCRRFAYLLHDTRVDDKPPATRWPSLRALLEQMERHYDEHTSNTVKKFALPDWPSS